jgi:nitroimidazol reductase NimA-like FMN-containing flavoprotein (pyridoxamine 5'-phosphate oxidase superfamily)
MTDFEITERNRVKRHPERARYDRETVYAILDATFICQVGFVVDGRPMVIPTSYGRDGDKLYIHGAVAGMRDAVGGAEVCVTVSLLDGVVLARSIKATSINYRSVMVFAKARVVEDLEEKRRGLRAISEQILPGRWDDVRQPTVSELKTVAVIEIPLTEASAKVRTGPPMDYEQDQCLPIWGGVIPIQTVWGDPEPDALVREDTKTPENILSVSGTRRN